MIEISGSKRCVMFDESMVLGVFKGTLFSMGNG